MAILAEPTGGGGGKTQHGGQGLIIMEVFTVTMTLTIIQRSLYQNQTALNIILYLLLCFETAAKGLNMSLSSFSLIDFALKTIKEMQNYS